MILYSYAKLNLYLEVVNIRKDNYHNIKTLFERIDLSDKIILKSLRDKKIKIACNLPAVPKDDTNLAYLSAKLLQDTFKINRGVEIKIIKRILVGAGLGGGSSNAATVLMGLNKLWRLSLTQDKLLDLARVIGSDVPFFIYNSPFALGYGRGDKVKPLKLLNNLKLWHILVVPQIKVSTPLIYKNWDIYAGLTKPKYNVKILNLALRKRNLSLPGEALFNGLEKITTRLYPEVNQIKERLKNLGLKSILMSGSGPAVFGVVSSRKEAISLKRQLRKENRSWKIFITRTQ